MSWPGSSRARPRPLQGPEFCKALKVTCCLSSGGKHRVSVDERASRREKDRRQRSSLHDTQPLENILPLSGLFAFLRQPPFDTFGLRTKHHRGRHLLHPTAHICNTEVSTTPMSFMREERTKRNAESTIGLTLLASVLSLGAWPLLTGLFFQPMC